MNAFRNVWTCGTCGCGGETPEEDGAMVRCPLCGELREVQSLMRRVGALGHHDALMRMLKAQIVECHPNCNEHLVKNAPWVALYTIGALHEPIMHNDIYLCRACMDSRPLDAPAIVYPCLTIKLIEKEMQ